MTRARGEQGYLRVVGHALRRDNSVPLPHDVYGLPKVGVPATAPGYARCECGLMSGTELPTGAARKRWGRRHREEVAEVPWSNAALSKRKRAQMIDWPKIFAERRIAPAELTVWEESAPGCWTGRALDLGAQHLVVVDEVSRLCVAMLRPGGDPATPYVWLRMAETLGEMIIKAGYAVTCAAADCEHKRWPCPTRIAYAVTPLPALGAWQGTDDAARHRPIGVTAQPTT